MPHDVDENTPAPDNTGAVLTAIDNALEKVRGALATADLTFRPAPPFRLVRATGGRVVVLFDLQVEVPFEMPSAAPLQSDEEQ